MEKNLRQESSEVKRVVICGPESTGKSTLTQNLASHYNTSFAKEFARDFLQDKWDMSNSVCTKKDLIDIVKGQIENENKSLLKADKFLFCGFFPEKKQQLSNELKKYSNFENSLVFFISPKKINKIIPEIKKNFTGRKIVFCREISKIYEEFIRKNVNELELFEKEPKGELTVVVSEKKTHKNLSQKLSESDMNMIKKMINKLSTKEITDIRYSIIFTTFFFSLNL